MINLDTIDDNLHNELKTYTSIPQFILADEDIPKDLLQYPRLMRKYTTLYTEYPAHSMIREKEVVASEEEEFDKDIKYYYTNYPRLTLSITAYGEDIKQYLDKAREWFIIPQQSDRFFEQYNGVIKSVEAVENRKTFLETDYEERLGFDVIIEFAETIEVREKTIETVKITDMDGNVQELDL